MAKIILMVDDKAVSIQIRDTSGPEEEEKIEKSLLYSHMERFAQSLVKNAWTAAADRNRQVAH